jgi:hypothetical protein
MVVICFTSLVSVHKNVRNVKGPRRAQQMREKVELSPTLKALGNYVILDSYTIRSENLSLTFEKKWCHAELGSASCFCPEGEILKQVQDDKSQKFQISLASFMVKDALIKTNSYLRDSKKRKALLVKTVVSSTAVEGVHLDPEDLENYDKTIKIDVSSKPSRSAR